MDQQLSSADRASSGPASELGTISLVGAGPGAADLMTLCALRRLEAADVVFYDRLIDESVLDLIPRATERVYVGKAVGANAWPQAAIDRLIVAEALRGRNVVRLKSGDPSVFGRAAEEIEAASAAGIPVEIVPGVTAASAAAAALRKPLTERGETDAFVVATAVCKPGDPAPVRARFAQPGVTTAFYMGVDKAREIEADLIAAGAPAICPVDIVSSASTARERCVSTTLGDLSAAIEREGVESPAILFVRYPKSLASDAAQPGLRVA